MASETRALEPTDYPVELANLWDPPPGLKALRNARPVSRIRFDSGDVVWLVTRAEQARQVLGDPTFSSEDQATRAAGAAGERRAPASVFIAADPPEHTKYRRFVAAHLTRACIEALAPHIDRQVRRHLHALRDQGDTADLMEWFARPLPFEVICDLLGIEPIQRSALQACAKRMMANEHSEETVAAARRDARATIAEAVALKADYPGDDLLTALRRSQERWEISTEDLVATATLVFAAGHETTSRMLGLATLTLIHHPKQQQRAMRSDTAMGNAVEELLRFLTNLHGLRRRSSATTCLGGVDIAEGDSLMVSLPSANRDERAFEHPDELDVERDASGHLGFGYGIHRCLGRRVATTVLTRSLRALFTEFPDLREQTGQAVPLTTGPIFGPKRLLVRLD
jgi:cytochrome P450